MFPIFSNKKKEFEDRYKKCRKRDTFDDVLIDCMVRRFEIKESFDGELVDIIDRIDNSTFISFRTDDFELNKELVKVCADAINNYYRCGEYEEEKDFDRI